MGGATDVWCSEKLREKIIKAIADAFAKISAEPELFLEELKK